MADQVLLTFRVRDALLGLPIQDIREIVPLRSMDQVPAGPTHLAGLIHLRDQVIQVLDLTVPLFAEKYRALKSSCIILLHDHQAGLLVDSVHDVLEVKAERLEAPPEGVAYLQAMAMVGEETLLLVDCEKLFNEKFLQRI